MKTPLHEALRQVRELQQAILDKQRFKGYSGRARALGGCAALAGALILHGPLVPATPLAHLIGWGIVFLVALAANYGAVIYWFWNDPAVGRDIRRLRPAVEILPVLAVGAVLTLALAGHGQYNLLFGMWMTLYALINFATRGVLPRALAWVGFYYLIAGAICLFAASGISFTRNPLVMGGVFFAGEFLGGLVLHNNEKPLPSLWTFFGLPLPRRDEEA